MARKAGKQATRAVRQAPRASKRPARRPSTPPARRPSKRPGSSAGTTRPPKVRVRMYRQGLGDCFLITFDVDGRRPVHMLIDCGSLGATTTGVKMDQVIADIRQTTGGTLDVLVATHEHKDHVSGFKPAAFEGLRVERVWLAWTENPTDKLAQKVAKHKDDLAVALVQASAALRAEGSPGAQEAAAALNDVLAFAGEPEMLGAGDFAETINAAMQFVRTKLTDDVTYWKPGVAIAEAWLPGFRIYVLGPPYSEKALLDTGENGGDLFGLIEGLRCGAAFRASGRSASAYEEAVDRDEREAFSGSQPFDRRFRLEPERYAGAHDLSRAYLADDEAWRRIDSDWLNIASDLALQLDNATNNTSLALAIERIADGKVLLMPADAQQGNWLSWHDPALSWTVPDGEAAGGPSGPARESKKARTVTIADLLARTVFYKAGHHASHNGTMRAHGLEMMTQAELTTFIPVDRAVALGRHPQGAWRMPAAKLYRAMLEKCQGRVVRSDLGWADAAENAKNQETERELRQLATPAEWKAWKQSQAASKRVSITPLFIDFVLD